MTPEETNISIKETFDFLYLNERYLSQPTILRDIETNVSKEEIINIDIQDVTGNNKTNVSKEEINNIIPILHQYYTTLGM
jgi:hypothetical protein